MTGNLASVKHNCGVVMRQVGYAKRQLVWVQEFMVRV